MDSLATSISQFALEFSKKLAESAEGKNIVFSPWGISASLAMVYLGARGTTAAQMAQVLQFNRRRDVKSCPEREKKRRMEFSLSRVEEIDSDFRTLIAEIIRPGNSYILKTANRIYGEKTYPFHNKYLEDMKMYFNAEPQSVNFVEASDQIRKEINSWIESQTGGKISNLLPDDSLDSMTRMVLVNALYFKGTWEHQFLVQNTTEKAFRINETTSEPVQMMFMKGKFQVFHIEKPPATGLQLYYESRDLSLLILLPEDVSGLEQSNVPLEWLHALRKQTLQDDNVDPSVDIADHDSLHLRYEENPDEPPQPREHKEASQFHLEAQTQNPETPQIQTSTPQEEAPCQLSQPPKEVEPPSAQQEAAGQDPPEHPTSLEVTIRTQDMGLTRSPEPTTEAEHSVALQKASAPTLKYPEVTPAQLNLTTVTFQRLDVEHAINQYSVNYIPEKALTVQKEQKTTGAVIICELCTCKNELEQAVTYDKLKEWTNEDMMELYEVQLHLPKFKLEESYDLKPTLSSMGMSDAFSQSKADFSGMSSEKNLFLSNVFHKAFVEINEQGTEAAAGTGSEVSFRMKLPSIEFNADHPFLFLIRHNKTKSILLYGRFCAP